MASEERRKRDPYLICAICRGDVMVVRVERTTIGKTTIASRNVYRCKEARPGDRHKEIKECRVCRKPRTVWADNRDICWVCYLTRRDELGPEDRADIRKWIVRF